MEFRKFIFSWAIVAFIIFITVVGTTYAYYVTDSGSIDVETGIVNDTSAVTYVGENYINVNTGVPILSSEIDTKASKASFTLTPNIDMNNEYIIGASIGLSDIDIDGDLKVNDFRYRLVCKNKVTYSDGTVSYGADQIFNGNATEFTNSSYSIATLSSNVTGNSQFIINNDSDVSSQLYECTLYMWLEDTGLNQNNLMGKHFGANIEVNSVLRKR